MISPEGTAEVCGMGPQPFLRNLSNQTTIPGDESPSYRRVIPPGWPEFQSIPSLTFYETQDELFFGETVAFLRMMCEIARVATGVVRGLRRAWC